MKFRLLLAFILSCSAFLSAQTFRGTIQGTVTDLQGAVIVGADVTVSNPETGLTRTIQTGATGEYSVPELPIGAYQVTAKKSGFQDRTIKQVKVEVSATSRVDVQLGVSGANIDVEVTAGAPLVDIAENNLGGTLEAEQFNELPVSGRDFTKLLVLVPGSGGDP